MSEATAAVTNLKVFRYGRGDEAARAEAQAFGRTLDIPESQLDWAQ